MPRCDRKPSCERKLACAACGLVLRFVNSDRGVRRDTWETFLQNVSSKLGIQARKFFNQMDEITAIEDLVQGSSFIRLGLGLGREYSGLGWALGC